jgi:hypothetical protein
MKYCTDGGERNKIATGKMDFVVTGWQKFDLTNEHACRDGYRIISIKWASSEKANTSKMRNLKKIARCYPIASKFVFFFNFHCL